MTQDRAGGPGGGTVGSNRGWSLLRLAALSALAGAIGAFGQAPNDLAILLLAAFCGAAYVYAQTDTALRAGLIGFAFGLGYFMHALHWIVSPFLVDVARHGWMAPFALLFLAAGMALFWGLAFWGARKLSPRQWPLILCFGAAELIRAYIFTGFPWAAPAQATVGVMAGQALAWIGPHGVNTALIACAVAIASAPQLGRILIALPLALTMLFAPLRPEATLSDHTLRLIQPNATQRDKWDPALVPVFFQRQLAYTAAGDIRPDLTIWPETAIPWPIDLAGTAFEQIAQASENTPVILGVGRRDGLRVYNAAVVLGAGGQVTQTYDKHHLVPFGEYMPLGDLLARFGIYGLAAQNGKGYSAGPGAALFDLGPLGLALPLICYEAVFAHDVNAAPQRPAFIIQVTNDAWFGRAAGPLQHLAQARMRAIEQGLPLARAANTGVSAMIDPYGRLTARLALNTAGFIDARLPNPLAPTPYSKTGDWPLALLILLGLIWAGFMRPRGKYD